MQSTATFDPETVQILRRALDEAAEALPHRERTQERKVLLASRILALAADGERDPVRLRTGAILQMFPAQSRSP